MKTVHAALRGIALTTALAAPASAQVVFDDVSVASGAQHFGLGKGTAMVDLDDDGRLDLIATNSGQPDIVYRQRPDMTFQDYSAVWGINAEDLETYSVLVADFDGDEAPDIYFITGGHNGQFPNRLYRNDLASAGSFTEVGFNSVAGLSTQAFGGTALDYDRDGDLDIFISQGSRIDMVGGCRLLRNDGGMMFTDVSVQANVPGFGDYRHCSSGDFDNDGWVDIGVGRMSGKSPLLRNRGDGTFSNVTTLAGLDSIGPNFGMILEDFDQDGWLDVLLPQFQSNGITATTRLYLNAGDSTFTDVSTASGIGGHTDMGHNVYDVDADGYYEAYFGTGAPLFQSPDVLYTILPDPVTGLKAIDISNSSGVGPVLTRGHGSSFGDYDNDGDIDSYLGIGGMSQLATNIEPNRLLRNQGNQNYWIAVELDGVDSSHTAAGARATAYTTSGRAVHRHLTVGRGFGNTDSPVLHFGLGSESAVDRIVIRWPAGIEQTLWHPEVGTRHEMIETGLRLSGDTVPGGVIDLTLCGAPNFVAELILATGTASLPAFEYGGVFGLAPPLLTQITVPLGDTGLRNIATMLPNDAALVGYKIYMQGWVHEVGVFTGIFTNVVELEIGA